jgi:tetratricopeptide (TPR) repeat protein
MDTPIEDLPSVEDLEKALASDTTNIDTRMDLVWALFDRFLYEDGPETDLNRVSDLLDESTGDKLLYERAYLAYINGDDSAGLKRLREAATLASQGSVDPFTSEDLWKWIEPLNGIAPAEVFGVSADAFATAWPNSAMVATLKALHAPDDASALSFYLEALRVDENYWLAAEGCADAYANLKDWGKAHEYYKRALASDVASESPDLWFDAAIAQGKLKLFDEEAESYRKCLELDPDYPYARNNLGWALLKARRNEEAVPVFQEAIERGNDGKYPLRNLADALKRLGRYQEAIEVLQKDLHGGRLTARARAQIAKLEMLLPQPPSTEQKND